MGDDQQDRRVVGGRYRLDQLIATGGMGEVWLAEDQILDRPVAVKLLHADAAVDDIFARRFREEARLLARLSHRSIVAVHDYGEDDGAPYLVMEFVPGRTVAQLLRDEGAQSPAATRALLVNAASALTVAHQAGIVHRDVKPGNIIVTDSGQAKLTDFGIARMLEEVGLTRTGEVLGTPQYLSPEQAIGHPADARSDLYALGLVGFEMLTATRAFDRSTPVATALAQVNDPPPPLPSSVPPGLADVLLRCLAKDPDDRPATAEELAGLLTEVQIEGGSSPAPVPVPVGAVPGRGELRAEPPGGGSMVANPVVLTRAEAKAAAKQTAKGGSGPAPDAPADLAAPVSSSAWRVPVVVSLVVLVVLLAIVVVGR